MNGSRKWSRHERQAANAPLHIVIRRHRRPPDVLKNDDEHTTCMYVVFRSHLRVPEKYLCTLAV